MAEYTLKGYVEVKDRIKAFLESEKHQGWYYLTEIVDNARPKGVVNGDGLNDSPLGYVQFKATVYDDNDTPRSTGFAQEIEGLGMVNKTSYLENCETSAIGRALGMLGFGIEKSIASKDEIDNAQSTNKGHEVWTGIIMGYDNTIETIKTAIKELCQKCGVRLEDMQNAYKKRSWNSYSSANADSLLGLEKHLQSINNANHEWHSLYNTNSNIKNPVPVGQEIVYKSSQQTFGEYAMYYAKDRNQQLEIQEFYASANIKLDLKGE
jgi:DnaJ-domain-containing protein 1